jgi:nicotinate-nucleotide pyrophosphorylase (carboxylating)
MIFRLEKNELYGLIKNAVYEDLSGYGDITSKYVFSGGDPGSCSAYMICKEPGGAVLAGIDVASFVFEEIDPGISVKHLKEDGSSLGFMEKICSIKGPALSLLKSERTCLNFMQHMSGIATLTRRFVDIARPYGVRIADTRKTMPLLRKIEKYAVLSGGGYNHRFGLFDGVLIKDNHIAAAGSISGAIKAVRENAPHTVKIEVEVKDLTQMNQAIEGGADIIMLDNMDPSHMAKAVKIIRSKKKDIIIEASGNINLNNLEEFCKTGIDIISTGTITHSAPAVDISLEFDL